MFFLLRW